jgi:hypothetical protein
MNAGDSRVPCISPKTMNFDRRAATSAQPAGTVHSPLGKSWCRDLSATDCDAIDAVRQMAAPNSLSELVVIGDCVAALMTVRNGRERHLRELG